ncbi:MAG TPA: hypothetical protein VF020_18455 [Chthoniobacterales bacterium]
MAESTEDKSALSNRLEEDRLKMAAQVGELKNDYNLLNRLRQSVKKEPWYWVSGALLIGFLLSRLPARRKKVYIRVDRSETKNPQTHSPPARKTVGSRAISTLWSLIKPIITAYIGREIYKRAKARQSTFRT